MYIQLPLHGVSLACTAVKCTLLPSTAFGIMVPKLAILGGGLLRLSRLDSVSTGTQQRSSSLERLRRPCAGDIG